MHQVSLERGVSEVTEVRHRGRCDGDEGDVAVSRDHLVAGGELGGAGRGAELGEPGAARDWSLHIEETSRSFSSDFNTSKFTLRPRGLRAIFSLSFVFIFDIHSLITIHNYMFIIY